MTKREYAKMTARERDAAFQAAAVAVGMTLNAYHETPAELVAAARAGQLEEELREWLTPECHHRRGAAQCDHGFPAWFCRESGALAGGEASTAPDRASWMMMTRLSHEDLPPAQPAA